MVIHVLFKHSFWMRDNNLLNTSMIRLIMNYFSFFISLLRFVFCSLYGVRSRDQCKFESRAVIHQLFLIHFSGSLFLIKYILL